MGSPYADAVDGAYDPSWQNGGREFIPISPNAYLKDMLVQPDGKLVLAGDCAVDATSDLCMARLLPDGTSDLTFGPYATGRFTFRDYAQNFPPNNSLGQHGLVRQADGSFLLVGYGLFTGPDGLERGGTLARVSANGQLDLFEGAAFKRISFPHTAGHDTSDVESVALQPDGKIVVTGSTGRPNSNPVNRDCVVARYLPDGTPDSTFGSGTSATLIAFDLGAGNSDSCIDIALQEDGKIVVVGGAEKSAAGTTFVTDLAVARLNADGSYDTTFGNAGRVWFSGYGGGRRTFGYSVRIDRQGRIVIAGAAQYLDDDSDFIVARLLPNGALDPAFGGGIRTVAFDLASPNSDAALDLALQSDGKILVAGKASFGVSSHVFAIARLDTDGSLDPTFGLLGESYGSFSPGSQVNDVAQSIALVSGGLFIGGIGVMPAGGTTFGVARLQIDLLFTDGFE